jgi:hypothetical protein
MSVRIPAALGRLWQDLSPYPDEAAVRDLCDRLGHRWRRDAILTSFTVALRFVTQVLHGNTAPTHITLEARRSFAGSAYCQARARLPLALLRAVLRLATRAVVPRPRSRARGAGIARSSSTACFFRNVPFICLVDN